MASAFAVAVPVHSEPPRSEAMFNQQQETGSPTDWGEDAAGIVGSSPALQHTLGQARIVAPTDSTVVIYGETGTGKELFASLIHQLSRRSGGPFIRLNCAAIPEGLLESELFGHEKGAFTGAVAQRVGRFEAAHRGTLFLDEIGDIPLNLQSKLLRVLQEQEFERLGSSRTVRVDVRVIAATNRDLSQLVEERTFRMDLFYRLNVFPITLPPLRDRREDIPCLASHFAGKAAARMQRTIRPLPSEAMQAMMDHSWPGNVRELQNLIERAVILAEDGVLRVPPFRSARFIEDADFGCNTLEDMDREYILRVLDERDWVVGGRGGAAQRLGLPRTTLISKMKKLGIFNVRPLSLSQAGRASRPASPDQPGNPHASSASLVPDVA
jgi:formate hydrogenlyase transcriptional activator